MPNTVSGADAVISAINEIVEREPEPQRCAQSVQQFMTQAVKNQNLVSQEFRVCCNDDYTVRPLHVDPSGRFSICVMAWSPGQTTPIHDHIAWCVATVYEGTEIEETFDLVTGGGGAQSLRVLKSRELRAGDAVIHMPVPGDIHRVTCGPSGPAVSIHVYGCDIAVASTSIRATFDTLPILP
jgi:3-mercaptopropionate dioxygenase